VFVDLSEVLVCHRCGALLLGDPGDDPFGGPDLQPTCGVCDRRRNDETTGLFDF
jgi:hypothetical protein